MAVAGPDPMLVNVATFLGAAVVAVPLFKKLGLGSVLGYLAAGAVIGPAVLGIIGEAEEVLHVAEFGVVLLLFVLGLELHPSRLWRMRGEIFGVGALQLGLTGLALTLLLMLAGYGWPAALLVGLSLALSSTAFGVQILRERGDLSTPYGRRGFAILLFQDMAVVPLLALAALLAPAAGEAGFDLGAVALGLGALAALVVVGRYGLPWMFRLLARLGAEEVFTAAALLVVGASALAMQAVGLSMALGAFVAGVLLAETEFRHQLETDIEPFRSLFLGLFFVAVGMSVDWGLALDRIGTVAGGALVLFAAKAGILYAISRMRDASVRDSLRLGATLGQAGEFAFVLLAIAAQNRLLTPTDGALLTAAVGVSMGLTPLAVRLVDRWEASRSDDGAGLPTVDDAKPAKVIVAGFGRAGQIVSRILRLRGYDLTIIDNSAQRIRIAKQYGDEVFFGDGARLDVLTMAGAAEAEAIFLCINDREGAQKAVSRLRERFPDKLIFAMTYDRFSEIEMRAARADVIVRQVFESAVELARRGLEKMGDDAELDETIAEFRRRDEELIRLQIQHGAMDAVRKMREKYEIEKVV